MATKADRYEGIDVVDVKREGVRTPDLVQVSKELISKYVEERDIIKVKKYNI